MMVSLDIQYFSEAEQRGPLLEASQGRTVLNSFFEKHGLPKGAVCLVVDRIVGSPGLSLCGSCALKARIQMTAEKH